LVAKVGEEGPQLANFALVLGHAVVGQLDHEGLADKGLLVLIVNREVKLGHFAGASDLGDAGLQVNVEVVELRGALDFASLGGLGLCLHLLVLLVDT